MNNEKTYEDGIQEMFNAMKVVSNMEYGDFINTFPKCNTCHVLTLIELYDPKEIIEKVKEWNNRNLVGCEIEYEGKLYLVTAVDDDRVHLLDCSGKNMIAVRPAHEVLKLISRTGLRFDSLKDWLNERREN